MEQEEVKKNSAPSESSQHTHHDWTMFGIDLTEILRDRGGNTVLIVLGMALLVVLGHFLINSEEGISSFDGKFVLLGIIILVIIAVITIALFRKDEPAT